MSGEKIPENLLIEVAYSKKRVLRKEYTRGKLVTQSEYCDFPVRNMLGLNIGAVSSLVVPMIGHHVDRERLFGRKCGITVDNPKTSDSDTVIRVHALPIEMRVHRVHAEPSFHESDDWLRDFVKALDPIRVYTAAEARGELPSTSDIKRAQKRNAKVVFDGVKWLFPRGFVDPVVDAQNAHSAIHGCAPKVDDDEEEVARDDKVDDKEIERQENKAFREELRRLELRRLRAEVIKAEIEAAEAIQNSDFRYLLTGDVLGASKAVEGILGGWA